MWLIILIIIFLMLILIYPMMILSSKISRMEETKELQRKNQKE